MDFRIVPFVRADRDAVVRDVRQQEELRLEFFFPLPEFGFEACDFGVYGTGFLHPCGDILSVSFFPANLLRETIPLFAQGFPAFSKSGQFLFSGKNGFERECLPAVLESFLYGTGVGQYLSDIEHESFQWG